MHACVVVWQVVDKHDLDHVADFGSQNRSVDTVGRWLLSCGVEACISVTFVDSLLPSRAPISSERSTDVEIASGSGMRRVLNWHAQPVIPATRCIVPCRLLSCNVVCTCIAREVEV